MIFKFIMYSSRRNFFPRSCKFMADLRSSPHEPQLSEPEPPLFGESLRIDSEDEENLEMLPEIERELILSERFQMLQRYRDEKALYDKYTKKDNLDSHAVASASKKRVHSRSYERKEYDDESMSDSSSSSYSSSGSDSSYSSRGAESRALDGLARVATDESIAASLASGLTAGDARKVQLTRELLMSSFQHVPADLRNEALVDSFVRIPNGAGEYLMCQVVGSVDVPAVSRSSETGLFELRVLLPNKDTVSVPVGSVSNSALTDAEVEAWASYVDKESAEELCRKMGRKRHEIRSIREFVWDDSAVNRMVEEKKKSRATSVKLTLEIAKLRTQLQSELNTMNTAFSSMSDEDRQKIQDNIDRINSEIAHLEQSYRATQRVFENANAHQFGIVAINHRNRMQQRLQDVEEARKKIKLTRSPQKIARDELNPFKRRECKPVVMWDVGKRSPKKELAKPVDVVSELAEPLPASKVNKVLISDLIDLDLLANTLTQRLAAGSAGRLPALYRALRAQYSSEPAPIWAQQLTLGAAGEVMTMEEWKRRVEEDME